METKISVGTGLIIVRNEAEILLVMDKKSKRGGLAEKWGIVGGMLEEDLTFGENAIKEALEETGYEVRLTGLVGIYQHVDECYNRISIIYRAEPIGKNGDPIADEISDIRWFKFDEIPFEHLRFPHNEQMIRDGISWNDAVYEERLTSIIALHLPSTVATSQN